jgi:DNA-binding response OmpR family regulator
MKILIIEDEKKVVSFIKNGLKSEGFTVETAFDGEEGLFKAKEENYDLIILDLMLPKLDGVTLCKELRKAGKNLPIIMLTARDAVEDRIAGLNAGADDYLTKPFSFAELLARIHALSRRTTTLRQALLQCADLTLDAEAHLVRRGNKTIELSPTEFKLLQCLMENTGRPLSKTLLLEKVWGYDFSPESNIVDVYIKYLRDKIDRGSKQKLLQTVRGIGYKLCA